MPTLDDKIAHRLGVLIPYIWLKQRFRDLSTWIHRPNFDGDHSRKWWETRDDEQNSTAAAYWEKRTHPSRDAIAKAVSELSGDTVLEIGCHSGPTLWALAQRKKFSRIVGVELSPVIASYAQRHLPNAIDQPVEVVQASADSLPFADASFDFVVTSGLLPCIGPKDILKSLDEMVRVCRGYLVLGEPFSDNLREASAEGRKERFPNTSYWIRNYAELLKDRADLVSVQRLALEDISGHLNSIMLLKVRTP